MSREKPLTDSQREQMYKVRDDFLGSIREFFDVHIITGDLEPIEKLVRVNRRFFDRHVKALKKTRSNNPRCMSKTSKKPRARLREIWSFHIKIGRFSFFVGLGEVRRA